MLTVVLVDDEELILHGLSILVDWNSIGYQIIHMSTDSVEAVKKIAELQPDVVLTDIKMPRLTGLDLISCIRQSSPSTKTIVISGYSDFDLAKKALQLGVFNYLLKPVDDDELLETLLKIRSILLQEKGPAKEDTITPATLLKLLSNSTSVALPVSLTNKPCFLVSCITDPDTEVPMEKTAETLKKWLSSYGAVSYAEKNGVLFLLVFGTAPSISALQQEFLRVFAGNPIHLSLVYSAPINNLETLTQWGHALSNLLHSDRFFGREEQLKQILSPVIAQSKYSTEWVIKQKPEILHKLRFMVTNMRFHEIPSLFAEMEQTLCSPALNANPYEVRIAYRDVLAFLKLTASDLKDTCFAETYINDVLMTLESADTILQISELVSQALWNTIQSIPPLVNTGKVDVQHIRIYLHLHLADDLSLGRVASLFFLSTSYLSTIFAKEIGQPFSSYVLSIRLKKATELLVQSNIPIGDICTAVGFSSEKTFFKQFRANFHCTPTEYRNRSKALHFNQ